MTAPMQRQRVARISVCSSVVPIEDIVTEEYSFRMVRQLEKSRLPGTREHCKDASRAGTVATII
jgi:hypothetical protein